MLADLAARSTAEARHHIGVMIDRTVCPDVERIPGAWCVKGTRIPVQARLDNAEDCTPEQIAGPAIFSSIPLDVVRRILAFAGRGSL
jgi:hypothetical protein